jgi:hypothetical protein
LKKTDYETVPLLFHEYKGKNYVLVVCTKNPGVVDILNLIDTLLTPNFFIEGNRCELRARCLNLDCPLNRTTFETWSFYHGFEDPTEEEEKAWHNGVLAFHRQKPIFKRVVEEYKSKETEKKGLINIQKMVRTRKEQTIQSAGERLDHYGVFELVQVATSGKPSFAVAEKNKPISYVHELEIPNVQVKAKPYERVPWILPNEPTEYESVESLFQEIIQCLNTHLETPRPEDLTVIVSWIMHTWIMENFEFTPYLFFYGAYECGKTRALEIIQQLAYRSWLATSITSATLYRPVEEWKPTLLLDESETFINRPEILGILNSGYKRGLIVPRQIQNQDGTWQTEWFDLFCPKAIAGTEDMIRTMKSRCIVFRMAKATRKIPVFIDKKRCATLRNKLLKFRFDVMLSEGSEQSEPFAGCKNIEEKLSGRLLELFLPLIQAAPSKYREEIIHYAQTINAERLREAGLSEEVLILSAILECQKQGLISNGQILIKHVTDQINRQTSYREEWSNSAIGRTVGRLGFERVHTNKGNALIWNETLIKKLQTDPRYETAFSPIQIEDKDTALHPVEGSPSSQASPSWVERAKEVKDE